MHVERVAQPDDYWVLSRALGERIVPPANHSPCQDIELEALGTRALGSVDEWVRRNLAGINPDAQIPLHIEVTRRAISPRDHLGLRIGVLRAIPQRRQDWRLHL